MNHINTNRISELDILKGFGIICVLIGHAVFPSFIKTVIYSFHMPLFFFCSGFFYKPIKEKNIFLIKKCKQILIPFIFFSFILLLTFIFLDCIVTKNITETLNNSVQSIISGVSGDENSYILYHTIWFLVSLFEVHVIYSFIATYTNIRIVTIISVLFYLTGVYLSVNNINLPYFIDTFFTVFIFFHAGYLFKYFNLHKKNIKPHITTSVVTLIFIFIIMIQPKVELKANIFPAYMFIFSISIIISLFYLSKQIKQFNWLSKKLEMTGMISLLIMGFHQPIFDIAFIVISKIPINPYLANVIMIYISLVIITIASKYLLRYTPYLLGK